MKIELNETECNYLADKAFWDWKRAEIDVMSVPFIFKGNKKVEKEVKEAEKFYRDLYEKLMKGVE